MTIRSLSRRPACSPIRTPRSLSPRRTQESARRADDRAVDRASREISGSRRSAPPAACPSSRSACGCEARPAGALHRRCPTTIAPSPSSSRSARRVAQSRARSRRVSVAAVPPHQWPDRGQPCAWPKSRPSRSGFGSAPAAAAKRLPSMASPISSSTWPSRAPRGAARRHRRGDRSGRRRAQCRDRRRYHRLLCARDARGLAASRSIS